MDALKRRYLEAMGIPVWVPRRAAWATAAEPAPGPIPESAAEPAATSARGGGDAVAARAASAPAAAAAGSSLPAADELARLARQVAACTACALHRTRTQTVFGVGDPCAQWMVVGEAPGADEDRKGEPFVGRAGKLLNAMLRAIGLEREQVYIANIIKCRPPANRDPEPGEAAACEGYLKRQIALVQPRVILAAGRVAAQNLLRSAETIGRMRGRRFTYADTGIPVVVTYHPAYLLRSPLQKRRAWEDLLLAQSVARGDP